MYDSLLVPLDGSPASEQAIPWALGIARQAGTSLHFARVHVPPSPIMIGSELASDVVLDSAIRQSERDYLEQLVVRLKTATTANISTSLLEGAVVDSIQDHAKAIRADLIVMTTHGRGAFARFWLGSIADKILRHSTVPTLLIRPIEGQPVDLTVRPSIHRIVIPLDGSELAERIVGPAAKLGRATGAEYALVLVLDAVEDIDALSRKKIPTPGGWFPEATEEKARVYLEKMAGHLREQSLKTTTHMIRHGSAAGAVLEYAATHGHAAIALATHGRSGIKRMFLGSVADKIVRGTTMPVLVYHPVEPAL